MGDKFIKRKGLGVPFHICILSYNAMTWSDIEIMIQVVLKSCQ